MKRTLFLSAILALCLGACEYQECDVNPNPEGGDYFGKRLDCSGTVCTENFVGITVSVTDGSRNPVTLDSFVVTDRNGRIVAPAPSGMALWGPTGERSGRYVVLNDGWVEGHEGLGSHFYAKGFLGGVMVFNEVYKISADCCHVSKLSGKDRIIVP